MVGAHCISRGDRILLRIRRRNGNRRRSTPVHLIKRPVPLYRGNLPRITAQGLLPFLQGPRAVLEVERLLELAAHVEGVIAVEQPFETEGVQVLLRHFDETRLDFNEHRGDVQFVQGLFEDGELVGRVGNAELADGLDVLDAGIQRPRHAHLLEVLFPGVLVVALARIAATAAEVAGLLVLEAAGCVVHAVHERLDHVVGTGDQLVRCHVLRHDHHDGSLHLELEAATLADLVHRLPEAHVRGLDARNLRHGTAAARVFRRRAKRGFGIVFSGRLASRQRLVKRKDEVEATLVNGDLRTVEVLRRLAEVVNRVDDRGRRPERDRRQNHLFHALFD